MKKTLNILSLPMMVLLLLSSNSIASTTESTFLPIGVATFNGQPERTYGLINPWGITYNGSHLFVIENGDWGISIFDSSLTRVGGTGFSSGSGDGQFNYITDIVATTDRIYVADRGNSRIQVFDHNLDYIGQFVDPSVFPYVDSIDHISDQLVVAIRTGANVSIYNKDGSLSDSFSTTANPLGISTNSTHIFVTTSDHKIDLYDNNGVFQQTFVDMSSIANGQYSDYLFTEITFDANFVYGISHNLLVIFDHKGQVLYINDQQGADLTQFDYLMDGMSNGTHLFLTELDNDRVHVLSLFQDLFDLATSAGIATITLSWESKGEHPFPELRHVIKRGLSSNSLENLASTHENYFVDGTIDYDTVYYYQIESYRDDLLLYRSAISNAIVESPDLINVTESVTDTVTHTSTETVNATLVEQVMVTVTEPGVTEISNTTETEVSTETISETIVENSTLPLLITPVIVVLILYATRIRRNQEIKRNSR